ncbi:MAG: alanine dehydrogenase, partial [Culicoidibacterales bacterium]
MKIGVPKERKNQEYRVGLTPDAVQAYCQAGHEVYVEIEAGHGSGFTDYEYEQSGARLTSQQEVWEQAELIIKIKEPLVSEYDFFRPGMIVYTYFHLAANEALTKRLLKDQVTAIAYETVQLTNGTLPLLAPMSEVAGRMAV